MPQSRKTEPAADPLDEEIRKRSRDWTVRGLNLLTLSRVELFRDELAELAYNIDQVARHMRKKRKTRLVERPARYSPKCEAWLKLILQADVNPAEKLQQLTRAIEGAIAFIELWPGEPESPGLWETKAEFLKFFRVMTRESPGRKTDPRKQRLYEEALRLHEEEGYSYQRIARNLIPDDFKKNPELAKAKIRRGVERLKKQAKTTR
jgi:hypothetical protein